MIGRWIVFSICFFLISCVANTTKVHQDIPDEKIPQSYKNLEDVINTEVALSLEKGASLSFSIDENDSRYDFGDSISFFEVFSISVNGPNKLHFKTFSHLKSL